MEVFKFNIVPMEEMEKRDAFKEAINNCPICNQHLQFQYETDFMHNSVKEYAHCSECKVQIREDDFRLQ